MNRSTDKGEIDVSNTYTKDKQTRAVKKAK
jgi:hypothetical protein